ncbi:DsbC family protein [Persephonella marina]|uniref:DsbC family protein n=1 Tax=Persephonella marina TaxID=309805 RepID=UPI0005A05CED|nr:DsbC family protein [Persephonella marina]
MMMRMFLKNSILGLLACFSFSFAGVLEQTGAKIVEEKDLGDISQIVIQFPDGRKEVGYITKDNKYLIIGNVIDAKTGENITAKKYRELDKVDVSKVPLDEAVKLKFGKGTKKLIMVADPDCPFCKKAYQYLKNKDVEVYLFLFPLNIHPQAYDKSVKILCSKDPAKAYDKVESGNQLQVSKCKEGEDKLKRHILIANKLGVRGTPLFIDMQGHKINGLNIPELEEALK